MEILDSVCNELVAHDSTTGHWSLLLEYPIPRRHKRLDAVLLANDVIICIEFKTEDKAHSIAAQRQVEDYALDLRDFHESSNGRVIVPIVVVPTAQTINQLRLMANNDDVREVLLANANDLSKIIISAYSAYHSGSSAPIDPIKWDDSLYRPVPTIIEAAELLFAGHDVAEIDHRGAKNLKVTCKRLVELVQGAQREKKKLICFVTGVPGAGKTLTGLTVVHNPALREANRPAGVFLSGNGPLVKIVSAALARDRKRRAQESGERTIGTFIQNVHTFIREGLEKPDRPQVEQVVVFDEAQRAWNADQSRKKNGIEQSEPDVLLSIMDRHRWAVVIALVGGGQEIHDGEAGLAEWGRSLAQKYKHWQVACSPTALELHACNSGHQLFEDGRPSDVEILIEPALHLDVNLRTFRAARIAEWVEAVLACDAALASRILPELKSFPLVLTRSLEKARAWLRSAARGNYRAGLLASSNAVRLRADGLELSSGFRQGNRDMYVHWFLNFLPDVRSSNQLEIAASEFECQGLEIDWSGVCWGGDLAFDKTVGGWAFNYFSGSRWQTLHNDVDRRYRLNTYRVLLTRARRGLVIWVPKGDVDDKTHSPFLFDQTAEYLANCGVPVI